VNASHPELEALAGLLDEPDGKASEPGLAAHVASCPRCEADLRALRTVQETLRALPAVPMPEDVAARLESAVRTGAQGRTAEPVTGSVSMLSAPRRRRRGLPPDWQLPHLSAAAGVAVLLIVALGTGIAVMVTRGGTSDNHTAASSAGVAEAGGARAGARTVVTASGADYQPATIRSQVAALVVQRVPGSSTRFSGLQPLAGQAAAGKAAAPAAPPATRAAPKPSAATDGTFGPAASAPANKDLTADSAIVPARTAAAGPLADPTALQACVRTLNGGTPIEPVLVDYARFDGRAATIIVLPSSSSPAKLVVWVEPDGSDCASKGETAYYGTLSAAS
jgi:hypothetical protein